MPGGSAPRSRYATWAISPTVRDRVGVPRTLATPSTTSMSSGAASRRWAAIAATFCRSYSRRAPDRGAEDRPAPAPAGAERVGRLVGVALVDGHVVVGDAEELAHQLRGRGLEALPVRSRAEVHVDAAVGLDADVRRLRAVGTHHALRLDVETDADAEQAPACELLSLPDAERVVVEHRRGLLERLRGRDVEHRDAERQRVRELVALQHVAPAQLERVDAQLSGETIDRLLAEVRLELPGAAVRARVNTCW